MIFLAAVVIPLGLDLYMPVPEENPLVPARIELGRRLFFDRRLSRDSTVSCASCHDPEKAFVDGRRVSTGVYGRQGRRNAPALINRGYGRSFFWDGRAKTLEEQVLLPIQDPQEMDMSLGEAARRTGVSVAELAPALASFVRTLLSGDSPFDRFANGDSRALSVEEQHGLHVFRGKGNCVACHMGPNFTDEQLHNTGIAWRLERFTDEGAGRGRFKTPTLREISRTAPYMHDGSLQTLQQVVDYYDKGGNNNPNLDAEIRPLHLTAPEKQALVRFLHALAASPRPSSR
jgi:cytochrome c peroxidase